MSDELEAVTEALQAHVVKYVDWEHGSGHIAVCRCGRRPKEDDHPAHAAAAVLAALKLTAEIRPGTYPTEVRYVTPWMPLEATESDVPTPSVQRTAEDGGR